MENSKQQRNLAISASLTFAMVFALVSVLIYWSIKPSTAAAVEQSNPRVSGLVIDQRPVAKLEMPAINLSGTDLEAVLKKAAQRAGLTGSELAAFMSQCAHETMNFFSLVEIGSPEYFRRYDPVHAPARARTLGNTRAGDGERYRGRGYIQLTGRYNYRLAGEAMGLPLEAHPELAAQPHIAAAIAIWYWEWRVQPNVTNFADVRAVTRPINPGLNGLADRRVKFQTYQVALL
jgi:predicted chitinase